MKYKIIKGGHGCWPMVKVGFRWKRIAIHNDGFGLYDSDDRDYPHTQEFCEMVIENYHEWKFIQKSPETEVPYTIKPRIPPTRTPK